MLPTAGTVSELVPGAIELLINQITRVCAVFNQGMTTKDLY